MKFVEILITGAAGQLGTELQRQLKNGGSALGALPEALREAAVTPVDIADADLTSLHEAKTLVKRVAPDVVLNCAAFTNVDLCETEPDKAFAVNALAARNLAMACEQTGAALLHVSTDYVFSGTGDRPFCETDQPAPQSVYGATKLLGEEMVRGFCSRWFILRTAWLYGLEGSNFVKTILRLAREHGQVKVVNDQLGNPTNAEDLAHHMLRLAASEEYGLYHCTGGGVCSWYDFAKEIVRLAGLDVPVNPCTTEEFPRPAKRPAYSALEHTMLRLGPGDAMRPWQEALADYMSKLKERQEI